MADFHSTTPPTDPPSPPQLHGPVPPVSRTRLLVLLGLLVLMVGALWYDYKVARPAVDDAYERIAQLNGKINSQGGKRYMTNQDVQTELKRAPFETRSEGGYFVEVYGWRAGLPTKRHKYYAVYTDKAPFVFLKHYKNILDVEELKRQPLVEEPGPAAESTASVTAENVSGAPGASGGQKKETLGIRAKESAAASDSNASQTKEPAAVSTESDSAKEKPAADAAQPKG